METVDETTANLTEHASSAEEISSDAGSAGQDTVREHSSLRQRLAANIMNSARADSQKHLDDDSHNDQDICRVCRLSGEESTLYHPCLCTGSIKYVHQDCLMQWLKYSKKEVCELCNHKFSFRPVYREDMPERLPLYDLVKGVFVIAVRFLRLFFTYCLVAVCWLGVVPLMASRIYRMVFSGLISSFFTFKFFNMFSSENMAVDIVRGSLIVAIFLATFISLVWLREQIMIGGTPDFLHLPPPQAARPAANQPNANVNNMERVGRADVNNNGGRELGEEQNVHQPMEQENGENVEPVLLQPDGPVAALVEDLALDQPNVIQNNNELAIDAIAVDQQHVFWIISLNIVFSVVFLYWPAQTGAFIFSLLGYPGKLPYFELPVHILMGYLVVVVHSLLIHTVAKWLRIKTLYTMSAMVYLMMKVFLLIIIEVILFPLACGWWLDICSLPVTGATLESRIKNFQSYPSSSVFLHWLVGMIYVFYSASFILILRELLRPGVLWFIRNLNDPEFNPVQEMIQQPFTRHLRRLISSTTLFFSFILLVVYFPLRLIRAIFPSTLPYIFTATVDAPLGEFTFELIVLQIVMPTVLEYSKAYSILKRVVRLWCRIVGGWLKLESYLLPARVKNNDDNQNAEDAENAAPAAEVREPQANDGEVQHHNLGAEEMNEIEGLVEVNNILELDDNGDEEAPPAPAAPVAQRQQMENNHLAARHQALLMMRGPANYEEYDRPDHFPLRICGLLMCLALTAILISFMFFLIPVKLGRALLSYLSVGGGTAVQSDLYTISAGLYFCWMTANIWMVTREWFQKGWDYVKKVFHSTAWLALRLYIGTVPLLGLIPFMLGSYFQLLVVGPLRVSIYQTPLFFPLKEWAMGVVHFKIFCASVLMGPDWWMKSVFEQVYADGIRGFRLKHLLLQLVLPIVNILSFQIAFPYVLAKIVMLFLNLSREEQVILTRYAYPTTLLTVTAAMFLFWQWSKLKSLAQKIRNDKYLIGTQLVNFYRDVNNAVNGVSAPSTSQNVN
ncbi:RING-variant domain-containing protein [Ditylenchus destructor]|uniref:RING-type E3 ubiquitin transferase n=1 Tax=Ditylenchus destructor TaxID=166010 RepID=A0AAD4N0M4_9BILA|nr:RING-variant domain-containing protein [Ditylenchus destructor]